jgi:uncharacterized membrane protein
MRKWDFEDFLLVALLVGAPGAILYEIGARFGVLAAVIVFLLGLLVYQAVRHESRTLDARRDVERAERALEESSARTDDEKG